MGPVKKLIVILFLTAGSHGLAAQEIKARKANRAANHNPSAHLDTAGQQRGDSAIARHDMSRQATITSRRKRHLRFLKTWSASYAQALDAWTKAEPMEWWTH